MDTMAIIEHRLELGYKNAMMKSTDINYLFMAGGNMFFSQYFHSFNDPYTKVKIIKDQIIYLLYSNNNS